MEGPPKRKNSLENRDKQAGVYRMAQPESPAKTTEALLSYKEARAILEEIGQGLDSPEDIKEGADIGSMVRGMDRPGVEGVDEALKYLDAVIRSKTLMVRDKPDIAKDNHYINQLEQQKAAREALLAERTKRLENTNVSK